MTLRTTKKLNIQDAATSNWIVDRSALPDFDSSRHIVYGSSIKEQREKSNAASFPIAQLPAFKTTQPAKSPLWKA